MAFTMSASTMQERAIRMEDGVSIEQHSVLRSVVLHLLPGVLILLFFVLLVPPADRLGIPPTLVLFVIIGIVLVPFELGYLLVQGKKRNGRLSLNGIVVFREKLPFLQFLWLIPALLVWVVFCFWFIAPKIEPIITRLFFGWLPGWFFPDMSAHALGQYSTSVLSVMVVLGFLLNGFVGPIVEELYFRGYLLPRLNRIGVWAPALNVSLFSVYHFFSPWQNVTRILALLPYAYAVWWKRNIYIGMITHCTLNTIGMIMMTAVVYGK
jgi:membrane protease YdiL (CAAX protease family)